MTAEDINGMDIAVIGLAGRFPGAKDIEAFWENLKNGIESVTFFSDEELIEAGVDPGLVKNPGYVKSGGSILEEKDCFDAAFFGYTPVEAELMDPQTRVFLETSWHALEDSGYDPGEYDGLIGLYAGSSWNFHWEAQAHLSGKASVLGEFASWLLTNRENLCTLVSYNLGLKGPSLFVKTTCSTSLVAVHLACQAILNGECEMAMAGGITIGSKIKSGFLYQEGMIHSPDGHCRAFDDRAMGTMAGEGVGIVVLKSLEEALKDRDHIYAVIKGTAVNNDGSRKIGYTAPSIPGQVDVIREALSVANVDPESITYVEAHGTGTPVGDPIEIEALTKAFKTNAKGYCRIGSVKTNIGHLDAAAGIAGLIKTILSLTHRFIPPSLHFQVPNSKIDFENSPFRVNASLTEWKSDKYPLKAGVSSFGIGGTNAHVILEEAPEEERQVVTNRGYHLILLSAKTEPALERITENLLSFLKKTPGADIGDVAYTLQIGRQTFKHRRMLVCSNRDEALEALSASPSETRKVRTSIFVDKDRPVVFMFPGLGAQYVNMGLELYRTEPVFREEMDRCFAIAKKMGAVDLKEILYDPTAASGQIDQPEIAPVAIFIFEYSLAKLLMQWGIKPRAMIGYSFGEYTAACVSGVFSLEDALKLVVLRGRLIRQTPEGGMLSVPLSRQELQSFLNDSNLSLAVDNGPSCILSGPPGEIDLFETRMKENRYICVRLPNAARAIHSHMMKSILNEFESAIRLLTPGKLQIPFISNVTGSWANAGEVATPGYWSKHLSETVQFAEGIKELLKQPDSVFLEVGPGYDLGVLLRHHTREQSPQPPILHLIDHAQGKITGSGFFQDRVGRLWMSGVHIDWNAFHKNEQRKRISLPLYPFERKPYWIDAVIPNTNDEIKTKQPREWKKPGTADWFYIPTWKRSVMPQNEGIPVQGESCWLVFVDETGLGERFAQRLENEKQTAIKIRQGATYAEINPGEYTLDPQNPNDFHTLFDQLNRISTPPERIAHFWSVTPEKGEKGIDELQGLGFYSLLYIAQAIGKQNLKEHIQIIAISNNLHRVASEEKLCPGKATLLGAVKVIPREYFNIACRSVDIVLPEPGSLKETRLMDQVLNEFSFDSHGKLGDEVAAYRGDYRWERIFEPLRMEMETGKKPRLKQGGVYLITGGLGGIGLVLAERLANLCQAKLALTGRSTFPDRDQWERLSNERSEEDRIFQKIKKLLDLEKAGAEVMVCSADVSDLPRMRSVVTGIIQRFGRIDGVIHAAGLPDGGMIPLRTRETIEPILAPKVKGTIVLDQVLKEANVKLDFFILCSSISSVLGLFGQIGYCAANSFLDAFAYRKTHEEGIHTTSINWDFWQEVGMGVETLRQLKEKADAADADLLLQNGILPSEGAVVFENVLDSFYPQVIISVQELAPRFQSQDYRDTPGDFASLEEIDAGSHVKNLRPRPELSTEYVSPETEFEETFAAILQRYFGFEHVGIEDNLFEYGITSLEMIHINNVLRKKIDTDIPIVVMFSYPTIRSLGQYLETQKNTGTPLENLDEVEDLLHESIGIFEDQ